MGVTLLKMRWSPRCPVIASPCEWIIMSAKSNGKLKLVTTEMPSSWPGKVYEPGIALGEVLYRTSLKELLPYIEETGELHQWIILICHIHIIILKSKNIIKKYLWNNANNTPDFLDPKKTKCYVKYDATHGQTLLSFVSVKKRIFWIMIYWKIEGLIFECKNVDFIWNIGYNS